MNVDILHFPSAASGTHFDGSDFTVLNLCRKNSKRMFFLFFTCLVLFLCPLVLHGVVGLTDVGVVAVVVGVVVDAQSCEDGGTVTLADTIDDQELRSNPLFDVFDGDVDVRDSILDAVPKDQNFRVLDANERTHDAQ